MIRAIKSSEMAILDNFGFRVRLPKEKGTKEIKSMDLILLR